MLGGAIVSEVIGTLALRAGLDHPAWLAVVAVGYVVAFSLLAAVLATGVPVGVAYGIWAACGVALTAVLATLVFAEPFTLQMGLGIALVVLGVLLVEIGYQRAIEAPVRVEERVSS